MEKKKLTKYLWFGSDVDDKGKPIVPEPAKPGEHLGGLNEGEVYIHNHPDKPALYIRTTDGEIVPIGADNIEVLEKIFLRKDKDDRSVGTISSDKGFEVGVFQPGELGSGGILKIDEEGNSYLEVDKALFRKIAYFVEIMIKKLSHVGGSIILSPASMRCSKVETFATYYRCYFESEQEGRVISQEFVVGDQARAQTFNIKEGLSQNVSNQYYWRLVVGVGDNYIDLSIADCDSGSGIPQAGDDIVLLGNRNDASRQNAIVLSSYGEGTPSFRQYKGIKTYSMADAQMTTEFSPESNIIIGKFITESGKSIEDELGEVKVNWDKVLSQTDKEFTMWFFDYSPSADMLPESDWTTDDLKALHEEDLFYNTNVDHEDGGKAWRYVYNEELGKYAWEIVTDAETIKALEKASDAQKTADSKIRNFVAQPIPPYDEGDRWSNATYGDLFDDDDLVCITPKAEGESFSIEDWRPVAYGKTSVIKNMEGEIQLLVNSFELGADGKYYLSKEAGVNITTEMASLYATKTEYNTLASKVSSNSSKITATANSLSAFTEKISFDSSGNVTNISKSGLVTTSNHATLFASEVNSQGIATQSYVRAQVSDGISNITITADNVDINNGVVEIDSNSAKIGGFTVYSNRLENSQYTFNGSPAYISLYSQDLSNVAYIGAPSYAMGYFRSDTGTALSLYTQGAGVGLEIIAQQSSWAIDSIGRMSLVSRYSSELITVSGLALAYKYGNDLKTPVNPSIPTTSGMWVDFLVLNGNLTLPNPSNCHGKLLFVKCTKGLTLTVPDCVVANASYTSYTKEEFNEDNHMRAFFSAGSRWFELNLTNT